MPDDPVEPEDGFAPDRLSRLTAPPELEDAENRRRWGLGDAPEDRGPYLVELNVQHVRGLAGAATAFRALHERVFAGDGDPPPDPVKISKSYFRCELNVAEWKRLVAEDEQQAAYQAAEEVSAGDADDLDEVRHRIVYKLWPDFPVGARITRSIPTIKADAALRSFDASGDAVTWAVIDSGIDGSHPHFGAANDHALLDPRVRDLHRCFVPVDGVMLPDPDDDEDVDDTESRRRRARHREHALADPLGHGTHVAGIIAGRVGKDVQPVVLEKEQRLVPGEEDENLPRRRDVTHERVVHGERERERFHGVAPGCRLVSLRVLDEAGNGRSSNIVRALEYIREQLNDNPKLLRVHGVNLSVGYEFDAEMFACGQSPLCTEVNRLVQSGVVVVTAAGNTGYSTLTANGRVTKVGLSNTINDPGNAEMAITVGSTHREAPHTYGISYFSSKGPTGDGRLKPDLVAPGERIVSCAAGAKLQKALAQREAGAAANAAAAAHAAAAALGADVAVAAGAAGAGAAGAEGDGGPGDEAAADGGATDAAGGAGGARRAFYLEDSGTSMAAPHVSGAIAAFLSIRREFIGRPVEVKRIFLDSAIPLGRERYFEGHGLLDLMKAIQSV